MTDPTFRVVRSSLPCPSRIAWSAFLASVAFALPAVAKDPPVTVRLEAAGAVGLNEEPADHGLGVAFIGQGLVRIVDQVSLGIRIGGQFFPPDELLSDFNRTAYELGATVRPAAGLWVGAFLGYEETLGEGGFGLDLLAGYELDLGSNAGIGPFVGYGLSAGDQTLHFMDFGVSLRLGLFGPSGGGVSSDDPDGDGMIGDADRCPDEAEDVDDFEDEDGCPELDNDGDRIADSDDECDGEAEDTDGFEDDNGCPDLDNDGDGVADATDRAPNDAEDTDGFEDQDGAPDPDNDADGVLDAADRAPNEPEDRDQFQDEDGAPDPDNDGDGVMDTDDQCPTAPGPAADHGCPSAVRVEAGRIRILQRIEFATARATLLPTAFPILDQIKAALLANPQILEVEVQGHTDDRGNDQTNMTLSQGRAASVVTWLTEHGVAADRLDPHGYGETRPLAPNTNNTNRQGNRRVELVITDPPPPAEAAAPATPAPAP
jgi:outer membrane protein OmpA-like peptidoglycan-associated protein